jgi:hypothetical protein
LVQSPEKALDIAATEIIRPSSYDWIQLLEDGVDIVTLLSTGERADFVFELVEGFWADTYAHCV